MGRLPLRDFRKTKAQLRAFGKSAKKVKVASKIKAKQKRKARVKKEIRQLQKRALTPERQKAARKGFKKSVEAKGLNVVFSGGEFIVSKKKRRL